MFLFHKINITLWNEANIFSMKQIYFLITLFPYYCQEREKWLKFLSCSFSLYPSWLKNFQKGFKYLADSKT